MGQNGIAHGFCPYPYRRGRLPGDPLRTIELLIGKPNSSDATQDDEQLMLFREKQQDNLKTDCPAVSVFLPTFSIKGGEKIAFLRGISVAVIPLREKMGNYDMSQEQFNQLAVIPLREKMGNYDPEPRETARPFVIPLREKMGNYDYGIS